MSFIGNYCYVADVTELRINFSNCNNNEMFILVIKQTRVFSINSMLYFYLGQENSFVAMLPYFPVAPFPPSPKLIEVRKI